MTQWWSQEELADEQARYSGHDLWLTKGCGVVHDTFDAEPVAPDPNAIYWDAIVAVQAR